MFLLILDGLVVLCVVFILWPNLLFLFCLHAFLQYILPKKTRGNCDIDDSKTIARHRSFFNNDSQNSHRKVVGFKKCWNLSCRWCQSLLLSKEYTFKNVNKISTLKTSMSCNSFNVIYVVVCSSCLEEYILETLAGKTRLRDYVRVYRQHIKQPENETF